MQEEGKEQGGCPELSQEENRPDRRANFEDRQGFRTAPLNRSDRRAHAKDRQEWRNIPLNRPDRIAHAKDRQELRTVPLKIITRTDKTKEFTKKIPPYFINFQKYSTVYCREW